MSLKNPLTSQIIEEYNYLFALIKRSLKPLEEATSKKISNDEIAYFTIHFGGYLENIQKESITEKIIAMVICPNGISSSLILRAELKQIFPTIEFYTMSFNDYKKNRTISPQYKTQADEIAKVISNKLELNHTAEEWLNALDKMF